MLQIADHLANTRLDALFIFESLPNVTGLTFKISQEFSVSELEKTGQKLSFNKNSMRLEMCYHFSVNEKWYFVHFQSVELSETDAIISLYPPLELPH